MNYSITKQIINIQVHSSHTRIVGSIGTFGCKILIWVGKLYESTQGGLQYGYSLYTLLYAFVTRMKGNKNSKRRNVDFGGGIKLWDTYKLSLH